MDDKIFLTGQEIAALIAGRFGVKPAEVTLTAHNTSVSAYVDIDLADEQIADIKREIERLKHECDQRTIALKERVKAQALAG